MPLCYATYQLNTFLNRIDQEEAYESFLDNLIKETAEDLLNDVPVTVGRITWDFEDVITELYEMADFEVFCRELAKVGSDPIKQDALLVKFQELLNEASMRVAKPLAEKILAEKQSDF